VPETAEKTAAKRALYEQFARMGKALGSPLRAVAAGPAGAGRAQCGRPRRRPGRPLATPRASCSCCAAPGWSPPGGRAPRVLPAGQRRGHRSGDGGGHVRRAPARRRRARWPAPTSATSASSSRSAARSCCCGWTPGMWSSSTCARPRSTRPGTFPPPAASGRRARRPPGRTVPGHRHRRLLPRPLLRAGPRRRAAAARARVRARPLADGLPGWRRAGFASPRGGGMTPRHPACRAGRSTLTTTRPHRSTPASWRRPLPYLTSHFGNPSSAHHYAGQPRGALAVRGTPLASLVGAQPADIVFTGGGSESRHPGHPRRSAAGGARPMSSPRPPNTRGPGNLLRPRAPAWHTGQLLAGRQRRPGRAAVAGGRDHPGHRTGVDHDANSETGVLQPIAELARNRNGARCALPHPRGPAAGKIDIDVRALGVDLPDRCRHKMYAPKGIGAFNSGLGCASNRRFTAAGRNAGCGPELRTSPSPWPRRGRPARASELTSGGPRAQCARCAICCTAGSMSCFPAGPAQRLSRRAAARTLNVSITGCAGMSCWHATRHIAAATGSACHEGSAEPSPVLLAMGLDKDRACPPCG